MAEEPRGEAAAGWEGLVGESSPAMVRERQRTELPLMIVE